ncbi:hypothetical protein F511_00001 [Dorcoceras hygrometricum]|nr:hypothetical protein F511_00001 [Dorcoceras hygrometricum]
MLDQVLLTPISPYLDDRLIWKPSSHGNFTTRSAWELIRLRNTPRDIYTACWSKILSPTMSLFAWRWTQRKIPTDDILKSRGVPLASKCQCCDHEESLEHLFFSSRWLLESGSTLVASLVSSKPRILATGESPTVGALVDIFENVCLSLFCGSYGLAETTQNTGAL